jgi:hypothetical protein
MPLLSSPLKSSRSSGRRPPRRCPTPSELSDPLCPAEGIQEILIDPDNSGDKKVRIGTTLAHK